MIKLRFITAAGPISWIIRKFTWDNYSHVDFVLPEGYLGARDLGVKIRPLNYIKPTKQLFAVVKCNDEISEKVIAFATSQIGKPYDFISLLGFMLRMDLGSRDDKRFFCSELVAQSFEAAGYPLVDRMKVDRITPRDLLISPLVEITGETE